MTQSDILAIFFMPPDVINLAGVGGGAHTFLLHSNVHQKKMYFVLFSTWSVWHFMQHQARAELPPALCHHRNKTLGV